MINLADLQNKINELHEKERNILEFKKNMLSCAISKIKKDLNSIFNLSNKILSLRVRNNGNYYVVLKVILTHIELDKYNEIFMQQDLNKKLYPHGVELYDNILEIIIWENEKHPISPENISLFTSKDEFDKTRNNIFKMLNNITEWEKCIDYNNLDKLDPNVILNIEY